MCVCVCVCVCACVCVRVCVIMYINARKGLDFKIFTQLQIHVDIYHGKILC